MVQRRIGEFFEQGRQVVDELVGIEANVSRQPGTDQPFSQLAGQVWQ
jgi:hypothetical protein